MPNREKLAGWTHLAFALLYVAATWWHFKAAKEHWDEIRLR
jgi:hypothetical protein